MGFILDSNIYIDAARDPGKMEELRRFYDSYLPFTYLHAVVAQELLAGAVNRRRMGEVREGLIGPFERRGRVVAPAFATWKRSGEIIARMTARKLISPGGFSRSFLADVLLAASCRDSGHRLITANLADFERISAVERFEFQAPYPE
ncbi:MAG TPA: type II toxin-antitoxin system VapC family toxin [Longimicrobiaceae bacterium]|nr:type II toxin-antitoxin system VapC family toxin [Longimicrobiaceae bacterium]